MRRLGLYVGLGCVLAILVTGTRAWADTSEATPPVGLSARYATPPPPPPPSWAGAGTTAATSWTTPPPSASVARRPGVMPCVERSFAGPATSPCGTPACGMGHVAGYARPRSIHCVPYFQRPCTWFRKNNGRWPWCDDWWGLRTNKYWYEYYFQPRSLGDWLSVGTSAAILGTSIGLWASGDSSLVEEGSDVGELVTPAFGYGIPAATLDFWGLAQFAAVYGIANAITSQAKTAVGKWRPDVSNPDSYPSGHTTGVFAGASFLYTKYGPNVGVPAYLVAMYTGISRIYADKHFLDDVIAGAGVGILTNWALAIPFGQECDPRVGRTRHRHWRLEFRYRAILPSEADVRAPEDGGTPIDFTTWDNGDDALLSAMFTVQYFFRDRRNELALLIDPLEYRFWEDNTPAAINFDGTVYAAGSNLVARWLGYEYKLRWRYDFTPQSCWSLKAGATAVLGDYLIEIARDDQSDESTVSEVGVMVRPHVYAGYDFFNRKVRLWGQAEGIPGVDFAALDLQGGIQVKLGCQWDLGVGYRWAGGLVERSALKADLITESIFVSFARSF